MTLQIAVRGMRVFPSVMKSLERKAQQAFDRFEQSLADVRMMLQDVNGPKGGTDKLCRVMVAVPHGRDIIVETRGDNILSVAAEAIEKAAYVLGRQHDRRISSRHGR